MKKPAAKNKRITVYDRAWRRKNLCRAIELAYGSLKTHYPDAIQSPPASNGFDAEAIREYAEIILVCSVELEFLAKTRHDPFPVKN